MIQKFKLIDNRYSTHSGVVYTGVLTTPELCTGLLLLMSFRHFPILKGFKQNSHGCNPWCINEKFPEPQGGFNL
jgi:hypothetical protein